MQSVNNTFPLNFIKGFVRRHQFYAWAKRYFNFTIPHKKCYFNKFDTFLAVYHVDSLTVLFGVLFSFLIAIRSISNIICNHLLVT